MPKDFNPYRTFPVTPAKKSAHRLSLPFVNSSPPPSPRVSLAERCVADWSKGQIFWGISFDKILPPHYCARFYASVEPLSSRSSTFMTEINGRDVNFYEYNGLSVSYGRDDSLRKGTATYYYEFIGSYHEMRRFFQISEQYIPRFTSKILLEKLNSSDMYLGAIYNDFTNSLSRLESDDEAQSLSSKEKFNQAIDELEMSDDEVEYVVDAFTNLDKIAESIVIFEGYCSDISTTTLDKQFLMRMANSYMEKSCISKAMDIYSLLLERDGDDDCVLNAIINIILSAIDVHERAEPGSEQRLSDEELYNYRKTILELIFRLGANFNEVQVNFIKANLSVLAGKKGFNQDFLSQSLVEYVVSLATSHAKLADENKLLAEKISRLSQTPSINSAPSYKDASIALDRKKESREFSVSTPSSYFGKVANGSFTDNALVEHSAPCGPGYGF